MASPADAEKPHPTMSTLPLPEPPMSPRRQPTAVNGFHGRRKSVDVNDYFEGPRDINKHSRWPMFMQMHGSILPEMILPLLFVGVWATAITCISQFVWNLGINSLLLTVLGFVVGLALSFRSSTAYERYMEGRKYWAQLMLTSNTLARLIWIHGEEPEGSEEEMRERLLCKLTAINLIHAFAVALKHKLRFEPYMHYDDLQQLVNHLDTFAKKADTAESAKNRSVWKRTGEWLGVPMAESNPRKLYKRATKPLGNLPLEIINHLSAYLVQCFSDGTLKVSIYQTIAMNCLNAMNDVLTGTDRVLNTPLPIAYSISISQITWVYVLTLPFQLFKQLGWVTIPGTMFAAYIILGIALIGREIENPFGNDVNDLPLDQLCDQLRQEIDVLTSAPAPRVQDFMKRPENLPLFPLSATGYDAWSGRSIDDIRDGLRVRSGMSAAEKKSMQAPRSEISGTTRQSDVEKGHVHVAEAS